MQKKQKTIARVTISWHIPGTGSNLM